MVDSKRMRRRILLAGIGVISGLFSAVGAQIVLTQGGQISTGLELGFPLTGVLFGATIGFLDLPRTFNRIVTVGVAVVMLTVVGLAFAAPARAQDGRCRVTVTVQGTTTDLITTSPSAPLIIDLDTTREISFAATSTDFGRGIVEISIRSVSPLSFLVEPGGTVLYYAEIDSGTSQSNLQIEKAGPTGFLVTGPSFRSPVLPFGRVELGVVVRDTSSQEPVEICNDRAWIRFVARPVSNLAGSIGLGLSILGLAGFGVLNGLNGSRNVPLVKAASGGPWIESHGKPHSQRVRSRVLDKHGKPVDMKAALVEGRTYRLELTLSPGVREREKDEGTEREVSVSSWSAAIDVEPILQIGFSGTPLSIEIPITPRRQGRHDITLDVTSNGHLLETDRITVSVVNDKRQLRAEHPQTTQTVFAASDFSDFDLAQRRPRDLLVILESDEDGTVDVRVSDRDGKQVLKFDSRLKAAALVEAAADVREQLQKGLQGGPGMAATVTHEQLEATLVPLVKAGRQMHRALFTDGSLPKQQRDEFARRVVDGATIQVIQETAGLGYSTLPWNLVYDHPFLPNTQRNRLCPEFPEHPADACPNRDDPEVMCPTGFWGYRAIVEVPWVSTGKAILTSPVGRTGSLAVGYLDAELSDSGRQAAVFARLGMERVDGLDPLLAVLRDQSERIGLIYFYAHHARDRDIGTHGIAIGSELLTSLTFDALNLRWKSRPLVFINGCASGDYSPTDPMSLLEEFRQAGAAGVVTTECAIWDPLAGKLGEQIIDALADGEEIGTILRDLRRRLLRSNNNLLGFVYRLQALSDATTRFEPQPAETIEIDLRTEDRESQQSEDAAT